MKKILIIMLMLITGMSVNYFTEKNEVEIENIAKEQIAICINEIIENAEIVDKQEFDEIGVVEQVETIIVQENNDFVVQEEVIETKSVEEKKEQNNSSKTNEISEKKKQSIKKTSSIPESKKEETISIPTIEDKLEEIEPQVEEKKELNPEQMQTNTQEQEEKIYCVDGGNTHILGDGENEHGYYKTWQEAFNAYEEYAKGWNSGNYMIDQCYCGLYYFWVTK